MIGNKIPRYLWLVLVLGASVAIIMLSMFYAQYRWLASEITEASVAEHGQLLNQSFERRSRAQLHAIADRLATAAGDGDAAVTAALDAALISHATLAGLTYAPANGSERRVGSVPDVAADTTVAWLEDRLVMAYPVEAGERRLGMLFAAFELDALRAEARSFAGQLAAKEQDSRIASYAVLANFQTKSRRIYADRRPPKTT